ncbi:glycosyltransferase family 4 protein [Halomonas daqiaonensis]|uniref:Glycosyltransferase involved in cell wall bisynthesis n=1 Tax=Halomonas daqiaonensis TaxID=650850 RepID=A0A1H7TCQ7_9GAMM|nr:glycosyltransferase family 4 protein [Halomonas daqiaonensis]SEL82650.1 Glycosyltransferase involved in cell wall bisynthesis [Halomonas daqiaonensis]
MPLTAMPELTLIVAGDPDQWTGGYVYDARMMAELRSQGWRVDVVGLEGRFPLADQKARHSLSQALATLPDNARVVIDGLAMGGLPDEVERHAARLQIIALVHHPLADETGLDVVQQRDFHHSETRALASARRVVVTSHHTARALQEYGVPDERIRVAEPGVDKAPLARGALDHEEVGRPWRLLCVATLTPRKGLGVLVEALAGLIDRPWVCEVVGSHDRDAGHAAALMAETQRLGLAERLCFVGERNVDDLAASYREADLFVLPSFYEGYGMVVTEALSWGLPVITTTGGALADTLPPEAGIAVPPGDADVLREALSRWMDDTEVRRRLRGGASRARRGLTDWQQAGQRFAAALEAIPEATIDAVARPERRQLS